MYRFFFTKNKIFLFLLFFFALVVYLLGMFMGTMEIDAAQYASMSAEMLRNKSFLQITDRGQDYLDKPPLLFWFSSWSMYIFGVSHFAYKLPSILSSLLGIFSVFQLTKKMYNKKIALWSVIILASSQGYILMNHDIRTDTLLVNFTIFTICHFYLYFFIEKKWYHLIFASLGLAMGLLSKGPIAFIIVFFAIVGELFYKGKWRKLLDKNLIISVLIIFIVLLPMNLGLYLQFEWEGLYFYYWLQSFGRITGESEWRNDNTIFYFSHTFLWAFSPWMIVAIMAVIRKVKLFFTQKKRQKEISTLCAALLTFIALSFSNYKLPHYIFITFPFFAILTAEFLYNCSPVLIGFFQKTQLIILFFLLCLLFWLCIYAFSISNYFFFIIGVLVLGFSILLLFKKNTIYLIIIISALGQMGANTILNACVYPYLLTYQGSQFEKYIFEIQKNQKEKIDIYYYHLHSYTLDFSLNRSIPSLKKQERLLHLTQPTLIITNQEHSKSLEAIKTPEQKIVLKQYPITRLTAGFINPDQRDSVCSYAVLLFYP